MDTIKKLCDGQTSETKRLILAAYYRGCADGLRVSRLPARVPIMLKNQAD